jgi:hypothetical protein
MQSAFAGAGSLNEAPACKEKIWNMSTTATNATNKAVADLLGPYSPEVRNLAQAARTFVAKTVPGAIEQVDAKARIIGYGFGTKYADMICMLMPTKIGVNLGIAWATQLPDPQKLLEGTGKLHRHVKLKSVSDLKGAALKSLLRAGIARWKKTRKKPKS